MLASAVKPVIILAMTDFYFERYMKQAEAAVRSGSMDAVTDGELITGIQDMGGEEAQTISATLPAEGAFMTRLLHTASVSPDIVVAFEPVLFQMGRDEELRVGWCLGSLRHTVYMNGEGQVHSTPNAKGMLDEDGSIYAYQPLAIDTTEQERLTDGVALNRYTPVNSTTMNDRAMLYGMAILAANHTFNIRMATAL
jgi:hypothetical protein